MASTLKHIELPIPVRGLNTDSLPSQTGPEYARVLHNVYVPSPRELRLRNGYDTSVGWYSTLAMADKDDAVINCAYTSTHPDQPTVHRTVIGIAEVDGASPNPVYGEYEALNTGASAGDSREWILLQDGAKITQNFTQWHICKGPTVNYNGVNYTIRDTVAFRPDGTTYGAAGVSMWAGANVANFSTGGVTINNGATSGTFSSAPANSLSGAFLAVTGGATGPLTNYRYWYRITSHTAGATAFTIAEPYGQGANTTNVPNAVGASTTIAVRSQGDICYTLTGSDFPIGTGRGPFGAGALALFRERMFYGRSNLGPDYLRGNYLQWSQPGLPQVIPSANNTLVGSNDDTIMGMATVQDAVLIFMQRCTYILTGYDEDSFQVSLLYDDIGCIHAGSIAYYRGNAIWLSEKGVYMSNGGDPISLSSPAPNVGVMKDITDQWFGPDNPQGNMVSGAIVKDAYVLAIQWRRGPLVDTNPRATNACWRYDFKTGAWTTWGNTSQNGYRQPWAFTQQGPKVLAVSPYQAEYIDQLWDQPPLPVIGSTSTVVPIEDTDRDTSNNATQTAIAGTIQFADVRMGGFETARVRGIQVEHNCQYYNSTSSPRVAWAVTLDVDSEIDTTAYTVDDVDARYIGNVSTPAYGKYYTDRFREISFPTEGAVFRVKFSKTATVGSATLFRVAFLVDGQATALGRVDNATL